MRTLPSKRWLTFLGLAVLGCNPVVAAPDGGADAAREDGAGTTLLDAVARDAALPCPGPVSLRALRGGDAAGPVFTVGSAGLPAARLVWFSSGSPPTLTVGRVADGTEEMSPAGGPPLSAAWMLDLGDGRVGAVGDVESVPGAIVVSTYDATWREAASLDAGWAELVELAMCGTPTAGLAIFRRSPGFEVAPVTWTSATPALGTPTAFVAADLGSSSSGWPTVLDCAMIGGEFVALVQPAGSSDEPIRVLRGTSAALTGGVGRLGTRRAASASLVGAIGLLLEREVGAIGPHHATVWNLEAEPVLLGERDVHVGTVGQLSSLSAVELPAGPLFLVAGTLGLWGVPWNGSAVGAPWRITDVPCLLAPAAGVRGDSAIVAACSAGVGGAALYDLHFCSGAP